MDERKLEVKIDGDTKVLVIREGEALNEKAHQKNCFSGDINAVFEFVKKRETQQVPVDKKCAVIMVNEEKGTLVLHLDPQDEFGDKVEGKLMIHHELANFSINDDKAKFDLKALIRHLKYKRSLFVDKAVHGTLINKLMTFTAKVNTQIEAANDLKGNKTESIVTNTLTGLELDFYLETELFKGFDKKKFKVDICFDVMGQNDIKFWFESVDLAEMLETERRLILHDKQMELTEFVLINQ